MSEPAGLAAYLLLEQAASVLDAEGTDPRLADEVKRLMEPLWDSLEDRERVIVNSQRQVFPYRIEQLEKKVVAFIEEENYTLAKSYLQELGEEIGENHPKFVYLNSLIHFITDEPEEETPCESESSEKQSKS